MTDPKYLTDPGSEASDFERELLQAAQGVRLTPGEKQGIWADIAVQALPLAAATPSAAPAAATSKAALSLGPLLKGLLVAVGVSGLSAGGYWLNRASTAKAPEARSGAPFAPSAAHESADLSAKEPTTEPESATWVAPAAPGAREAPPVSTSREPSTSKSALRDESSAVLEIRRTLRTGDASGALRLLEQARQRFPKGALSQEREALSIEALAKSGAKAAAARRAQAFLHAYPKSPYASDVQSFTAQ